MIYSMYVDNFLSNLPHKYVYNRAWGMDDFSKFHGLTIGQEVANCIKESKGDTFLFITAKRQEGSWERWIDENGLKDYINYEMPYRITNGYHKSGRTLKLFVLKSKEMK